MDTIKNYVRKNPVFVSLLSVLILITIGLGFYLIDSYEPSEAPVTPEPTPSEKVPAQITSFEGNYGKDAQVRLTWSIASNDDTITSVKLFYNGSQLAGEMKSLDSFPLPQSVYQFPTGDNVFTLKLSVEDGEEIERDVTVFVDYVVGVQMQKETQGADTILKLSYSYSKGTSVGAPRMHLSNTGAQAFEVHYVDTQRSERGEFIDAVTTFKITSNQVPLGSYTLSVRWIFDGLNTSYDYPVKIDK